MPEPELDLVERLDREGIARWVAEDLPCGAYVNLGIGMPTLVADVVPPERNVIFHSENGVLGVGPRPPADRADPALINAGKEPVTLLPGGAYMSHSDSFAIIRGGHLDLTILGAFEVSQSGDLANWATSEEDIPAVGGAMDLAVGAREVWVMMTIASRSGVPKLVERCSLMLTAARIVTRVYTDLAVFAIKRGRFEVVQALPGVTLEQVQRLTPARLRWCVP